MPVAHPLGVHLRQRHTTYLEDPGLGYSDVKNLFLNAVEWWWASRHNPLRDTDDEADNKRAFQRGEALHTFVLEGQKLYERVYGVRPSRSSHPDALDTVEELKAACARLGLDTRGAKTDLVVRLAGPPTRKGRKWVYKPKVEVLALLQSEFALSGKKPVTAEDDRRIRLLHRQIMRDADDLHMQKGEALTLKAALDKALTEVSVYWEDDNGIRMRARFDILKPNFSGDLKSISQWKRTDFKRSLLQEIILRGYAIQAAHYHHGRVALRQAVAEGRVFGGNKTDRQRLSRIAEAQDWLWLNVFCKMDGAPQVRAIVMAPESGQFIKAMQQRDEALANYLFHRELHGGMDRPWFDPEVVLEPDENDWPLYSVLGS